jgi:hypothetical protein
MKGGREGGKRQRLLIREERDVGRKDEGVK